MIIIGAKNGIANGFIRIGKSFNNIVYATSLKVQYLYFDDGTNYIRKGVRDTYFVVDETLTATGFDGIEDTDWRNIKSIKLT